MKSRSKPPLFLPDFERIFRAIHGVLLNEQCEPIHCCLYFGIIGAAILQKHHGMPAKPVVGAAGYNLGTLGNEALVFAERQPHGQTSSESAFHCWVESNGWAIDFQTPLFGDLGIKISLSMPVPRYMLQRSLSGGTASVQDLSRPKAYWYERNQLLESQLLANFHGKLANDDLVNICTNWYRPAPEKMIECIGMSNQHGEIKPVKLSSIRLNGAW